MTLYSSKAIQHQHACCLVDVALLACLLVSEVGVSRVEAPERSAGAMGTVIQHVIVGHGQQRHLQEVVRIAAPAGRGEERRRVRHNGPPVDAPVGAHGRHHLRRRAAASTTKDAAARVVRHGVIVVVPRRPRAASAVGAVHDERRGRLLGRDGGAVGVGECGRLHLPRVAAASPGPARRRRVREVEVRAGGAPPAEAHEGGVEGARGLVGGVVGAQPDALAAVGQPDLRHPLAPLALPHALELLPAAPGLRLRPRRRRHAAEPDAAAAQWPKRAE
jgi:hypothetical protein